MGKVIKLKYRLETFERTPSGRILKQVYGFKPSEYGGLSKLDLGGYIRGLNKSMLPGGVNEHVSKALGYVPYVHKANVINQFTGEICAQYQVAGFEVL